MSKKKPVIISQATIVVTHLSDGAVIIRSDNDGKSVAAQMADAMVSVCAEVAKRECADLVVTTTKGAR